ncbi:hypothetical protein GQ44DRAFT_697914 [Phaeosphaeriaceae sp. PMI808]|nr:hypothetical protein GQ44DRAFT_697914 [Phaeosphaeriaceae sp. PMI808]
MQRALGSLNYHKCIAYCKGWVSYAIVVTVYKSSLIVTTRSNLKLRIVGRQLATTLRAI